MDITKFAFVLETDDFVDVLIDEDKIKKRGYSDVILNLIASSSLDFNGKLYDILDKYTTLAFPANKVFDTQYGFIDLNTNFIVTLNNVHGAKGIQLDLSNNLISDILTPNLAAKFPLLVSLNLSGNNISNLVGVNFPAALLQLSLDNNRIKSILNVRWPDRLSYLNLNNNSISSIVGVDFNHVYILNLGRNLIDSIDDVEWPVGMQILNLEYNKITSIANARLTQRLQSLVIGGNGIKSFKDVKFPRSIINLKFGPDTDISDLVLSGTGKNDIVHLKLDMAQYTMGLANFINSARWLYLELSNLNIEDKRMLAPLILNGLPYGTKHQLTDIEKSLHSEDKGLMILNTINFDQINLYQSINKGQADPPVIFDLINIAQNYKLTELETINKILEIARDDNLTFVDAIKRLRTTSRTCKYSRLTECLTFNIYVDEYNCCYTPDNDIILDYAPILVPRIKTERLYISDGKFMSDSENYIRSLSGIRRYLQLYTEHGDRVLNGYYRTGSVTPSILAYVRENMSTFVSYRLRSDSSDQMIHDFIVDYATAMVEIFKNAPIIGEGGIIVYRGMIADVPITRLPEGIIYSNKGIVSGSLSKPVALQYATGGYIGDNNGLLLEFYLPKGTKAIYMESITEYGGEREVILPNNSKFIVETNDVYTDRKINMGRAVHRLILD